MNSKDKVDGCARIHSSFESPLQRHEVCPGALIMVDEQEKSGAHHQAREVQDPCSRSGNKGHV